MFYPRKREESPSVIEAKLSSSCIDEEGIGIQKRLGVTLQLGDYRRPLPSLDVLLTRALTCILIIAVSKVRLEEVPETCRRVELSLQEFVALSTTLLQSLCSNREDG